MKNENRLFNKILFKNLQTFISFGLYYRCIKVSKPGAHLLRTTLINFV